MSEFDLEAKFPELQPISGPPSLFSVNGIGTNLYGERDFDDETGTYVSTYCLTVLFLPVFTICAYRVAPAETGGWYFIGKEPLSSFAWGWNIFMGALILCVPTFLIYQSYTSSPSYMTAQRLTEADELAADGQRLEAAKIYHEIAFGTHYVSNAIERLRDLCYLPKEEFPLADRVPILELAVQIHEKIWWPDDGEPLWDHMSAVVEANADSDPAGAAAILKVIEPLAPEGEDLKVRLRPLLEFAVKDDPTNVTMVSELAVLLEEEGNQERCDELLTPLADKLGETEGARILGQIRAGQGKFEEADRLLSPYAEGRLAKLHEAEEKYNTVLSEVQEEAINMLRNGTASREVLRDLNAASEEEQRGIFADYLNRHLRNSTRLAAAQEDLLKHSDVVPLAFSFGIVQLRRAQQLKDAAQRDRELKKAEETFLAIRGLAGQTDEYRLYLGQVYYWLGKHDQGHQLFEELLAANNRDPKMLVGVGQILREVGAVSEARKLLEEAYEATDDEDQKMSIAATRAVMNTDVDDGIAWLERSNTSEPFVKANLANARGEKALQEGDLDDAAQYFREALGAFKQQSDSAATLNNGALAAFALFRITGDRKVYDEAVEMMEKAISFDSTDSILLFNAASTVLESALRDIIGDSIDLTALQDSAEFGTLSYLYENAEQREAYVEKVRTHAGIKRAIDYYEQVTVLAPKRADSYGELAEIYAYLDDQEALQNLWSRLQKVEFDRSNRLEQAQAYLSGEMDDMLLKDAKAAQARYRKVMQARQANRDRTFAVAACLFVGRENLRASLGQNVDADAALRWVRQAHQAAPSSATRSAIIGMLAHRINRDIARQHTAMDRIRASKRVVGDLQLLAVALNDRSLRDAITEHADFRELTELHEQALNAFGNGGSPWECVLLEASGSSLHTSVLEEVIADDSSAIERKISLRVAPLNLSARLNEYWYRKFTGDEAGGLEVLRAGAKLGLPVPIDVN